MLDVRDISSGYGKKQVLYDVSLTVKSGEVVLLRGGNGSGKSTLLKCIYNLLPLWNGSVWLEDERIDNVNPSDLIRKGVVYIPQKDYCFDNLTVEENLKIAGTIIPKKELKSKIENVLLMTGLGNIRNKKPFNLSGGEKKILAFGMSLIHKPKLVLFDEPFAGIDYTNSQKLLHIFKTILLEDGITFIFVEHKNTFNELVNRVIELDLGQLTEK